MDIQTITNSRYGINAGMAIARALPPRVGYFVNRILVYLIAKRKSSPLNKSIRLNQWIIHDQQLSAQELDVQVKKVLNHAARCLFDFFHVLSDKEKIKELAPQTENAKRWVELTRNGKRGGFIAGPHLSNFDLVFLANGFRGLQGLVLTYGNPTSGYGIQNKIRENTGLEIVPVIGEKSYKKAVDFMKSGGFVITGVDRPIRKKSHMMNFFGYPSPLPAGHIRMALEANVPVSVVAPKMLPSGYYDVNVSDPIEMIHKDDPEEEIRINGEAVLKVIENYILKAPEQWLMFYLVWPQFMDQVP
ncbi:MAG: lysophospholipid acyltransferase family protein [Anaerolineales bacterium]|nr:lysophospholipid acyltransferase family protein [Anaerolineales bacterium]